MKIIPLKEGNYAVDKLKNFTPLSPALVRVSTIAVNLRQKEIDSQAPGGRKFYQGMIRLTGYWVKSKQCFQRQAFTVQPLRLDLFNGSPGFQQRCF